MTPSSVAREHANAGVSGLPRSRLPPGARRPKTRERITDVPNFRDYGRTCERHLCRIVSSLASRWGECFASEAGLRWMIAQDTGHMPGVDVVRKALARLCERGVLVQLHLTGGEDSLPDGRPCDHGTRLLYLPQSRAGRRALETVARLRGSGLPLRIARRRWNVAAARAQLAPLEPRQAGPRARVDVDQALADFRALFPFPSGPPERPPD